jgi:hypothetical protein
MTSIHGSPHAGTAPGGCDLSAQREWVWQRRWGRSFNARSGRHSDRARRLDSPPMHLPLAVRLPPVGGGVMFKSAHTRSVSPAGLVLEAYERAGCTEGPSSRFPRAPTHCPRRVEGPGRNYSGVFHRSSLDPGRNWRRCAPPVRARSAFGSGVERPSWQGEAFVSERGSFTSHFHVFPGL